MSKKIESDNNLYFLPLGGAGEIGMNLNLYGWGTEDNQQWIMIDLGVTFGDNRIPGIDLITPDPTFIEARKDQLLGIILTHAHEDHLGAVPYLWERLGCPIYATPFAVAILKRKLSESGIKHEAPIYEIQLGGSFNIGPFDLEMMTLTHSIPEPNSVIIKTPIGLVLHTGDWKFDPDPVIGSPTDEDALRKIGDSGVKAIVCDSTNVFSPGHSGSEGDLQDNLSKLVEKCAGKVAIACFASNVARLKTIAQVAFRNNRSVILAGRSLWRIDHAARENGYLADIAAFIKEEDAHNIPDENLLIISTGSQGETRAALNRIASGSHRYLSLGQGDTVIFSSRIIPGNETAISELQNNLIRNGVDILTERDAFIHVSGHPNRGELTRMYQYIRPEIAIPVHGEIRHLKKHAELANECQVEQAIVAENGTMICLGPNEPCIVKYVPVGRLSYEGNRLVPIKGEIVRSRNRALYNGSAVVSVAINIKGKLHSDPLITTTGLIEDGEDKILKIVHNSIREAIDNLPVETFRDDNILSELIRTTTRRTFYGAIGKRPITAVHLIRI